jgi:hypothetical protein
MRRVGRRLHYRTSGRKRSLQFSSVVVEDVRVVTDLDGLARAVALHGHRLDLLVEPAGVPGLLREDVRSVAEPVGLRSLQCEGAWGGRGDGGMLTSVPSPLERSS